MAALQLAKNELQQQEQSGLKDYVLGRQLGSGAFGTVRLAAELSSGKQVR